MTGLSLQQQFADSMGQLLGPDFPSDIALAVSGGGDSMAMLYLAHNWTRDWGVRLHVVTVDHGLRSESAGEAAMVARECAALGWPHATLTWAWDGKGNKMDAARRGRLGLIEAWRGGIGHVLMAHTEDDLAENFLMRLRRGAGLDGLSAMEARRYVVPDPLNPSAPLDTSDPLSTANPLPIPPPDRGRGPVAPAGRRGFHVIRPCLGMSRADLRHYLRTLQGPWVDDPSNDDPQYDRARVRKVLDLLSDEGIDRTALAAAALRLRDERTSARRRAAEVWARVGETVCTPDGRATSVLRLKPEWHHGLEVALQRRILSAMLRFVSGADYAPRGEALEALRDRVVSGGTGTLHGCEVSVRRGLVYVFRELSAVESPRLIGGANVYWDGRWRVPGAAFTGHLVRALGEDGWQQVAGSAEVALPHRAALSLPSIWAGDRLVACDAVGVGPGGATEFWAKGMTCPDFHDFLLSH